MAAQLEERRDLACYSSDEEEEEEGREISKKPIPEHCLKCNSKPVEYLCDPCGCPCFCKTCAMKLATGGKCKSCKQFFSGLRKLS